MRVSPGNTCHFHYDLAVVRKREFTGGVVEIKPDRSIFLNITSESEMVSALHWELRHDVR